MQFFYEFFPIFLFFLAFKFAGIYVATIVGISVTLLQVLCCRLTTKKWDKKQLITLIIFLIFGGMTLYFHNPIFIQWKPTIIYWIFAAIIMGSQLFTHKPIIERLMENVFQDKGEVPKKTWKYLNMIWGLFFSGLGIVNLYIAYHFDSSTWVNFKFYGVTGALLLLSILQALYLMRYITHDQGSKKDNNS